MDGVLAHEIRLPHCQILFADDYGVCDCDLLDILVEGVSEVQLNALETIAAGGMSNDQEVLEASFLHVVFPDMIGVVCHGAIERYFLAGYWIRVVVGVHY